MRQEDLPLLNKQRGILKRSLGIKEKGPLPPGTLAVAAQKRNVIATGAKKLTEKSLGARGLI